jgi:hypothetical protein
LDRDRSRPFSRRSVFEPSVGSIRSFHPFLLLQVVALAILFISLRFKRVLGLLKLTHFHMSVKGKGSWEKILDFKLKIAD